MNTFYREPFATFQSKLDFRSCRDENDDDRILTEFAIAGIDTAAVASQLMEEGVASFARSWNDLMDCIASKSETLKTAVA